MPDKKISELDEAPVGTLTDNDMVVVVDVSDTSMAVSGTTKKALGSTLKDYIAGEPSLINPVVHDDVKWAWITVTEPIVGSSAYVDGVITANVDGAIPTAIENGNGVIPSIVPVGSAANVAIGVQVGDRLYWGDGYSVGHHGIYVVTDLGSVSSPWIITRAADQQEANILTPFYVEVEDTAIVVQTTVIEVDPTWLYPSITSALGAFASGAGAMATSVFAFAFGVGALASGGGSMAMGSDAHATATNAVALGPSVVNSHSAMTRLGPTVLPWNQASPVTDGGTVTLDSNEALFWELDYITADLTFSTANLSAGIVHTCALRESPDIASADYDLTFPAEWIFVGSARPTILPAGKHGLLTVHSFGSTDETCYVTWHVEP